MVIIEGGFDPRHEEFMTLLKLCKKSPEWAANRLQVERKELRELKEKIRYAQAEFEECWEKGRLSIDCKNAIDALGE
jgi:hypothetical protein